jgi:hypothetical protein
MHFVGRLFTLRYKIDTVINNERRPEVAYSGESNMVYKDVLRVKPMDTISGFTRSSHPLTFSGTGCFYCTTAALAMESSAAMKERGTMIKSSQPH